MKNANDLNFSNSPRFIKKNVACLREFPVACFYVIARLARQRCGRQKMKSIIKKLGHTTKAPRQFYHPVLRQIHGRAKKDFF